MPNLRRFLTRRWLLAFLGVAALVFGLTMLHPYSRQSLFGPTIRGKPWCYWEDGVRWQATHLRVIANRSAWEKTFRNWFKLRERELWPSECYCNHEEMLPLLLKLANDDDKDVRTLATWIIIYCQNLYRVPALPVLREQMHNGHPLEKIYATRGVWRITKDKQVVPTLRAAINTPGDTSFASWIRSNAAYVLAEVACETPELMPEVLRLAKHKDSGVRSAVLKGITPFGEQALPILIAGLDDPDENVRSTAVRQFPSFGKRGLPSIIKGLRDPQEHVRATAIEVLKAMGPAAQEATPDLLRLMRDPIRALRREAIEALIAIVDPATRLQLGLDKAWFELDD